MATETIEPKEPIYVVSPEFSGVAGFATEAEAEEYAAAHRGGIVEAAQVDPDVRAYHRARLA